MRILIINHEIPYPLVSGSTLRTYNLLRRIAARHEVWLAAPQESPDQAEAIAHLQTVCAGVITGYFKQRHPAHHLPGLIAYALRGIPPELKFQWSSELAGKLSQLLTTTAFDIVQIEHSCMAHYLRLIPPQANSRTLLVFHDVGFMQAARVARYERRISWKLRMWLHSRWMRHWEPHYAAHFDRCAAVSDVDRALLLTVNPALTVDVVANGVDTQTHQLLPAATNGREVLFVGSMDYPPCVDGALYFCDEILPHLRQEIPDVELWIVGKNPLPEVRELHGNGIHVTGFVESVEPYYRRCAACIVPLRAGGGTRLKILEALALGRPVVSTFIGCEGLDLNHGDHVLLADAPAPFAAQVAQLLTDGMLYQRLVNQGRERVVALYDWDAIAAQLLDIYAELGAAR
jgi:glycosyltransferase involved in cell wall biosynthesis